MIKLGSTYPIGIDIHRHNIYAVQLKKTRDGLAVRGLTHTEVENGAEKAWEAGDALIPRLKEIANNKAFRGKRVLAHLPSEYTYTFPITIQVGEGSTVEEAILLESGKHLPFPVEKASIDYPSIVSAPSGKAQKYKATIIAAQIERMKQFVLMLKQAGLVVEAVDADIASLVRLHQYVHEVDADPIMLCHVGYTKTLLSIVTEDRILVHRSVPWGIQILLTKLQENLELSHGQSRVLLKEYGLFRKDRESLGQSARLTDEDETTESMLRAIAQIITPYLEALIYEFHNVIGYVISEEPDARSQAIYVYGHANFIRDLDRYLESTLNIPTKLVNPMMNMPLLEDSMLPDLSEGAPFSLALGLAMRKVPWL
jgi:type IV pilus assembly protein PilM